MSKAQINTSGAKKIYEFTLEELFPSSLTNTSCIYIKKGMEVWIATEMCAQYLESSIDSIIVKDDNGKPIGMVGGYDLLDHLQKNPLRNNQYATKVEDVMLKDLLQVDKKTVLKDLIEYWRGSRRAFAIIPNDYGGYSPISARKMLEIGMKCDTDISVSSMPKKKIVTFTGDESLGEILVLMYNNMTRKLVLEHSNQYISDRLILEGISKKLKYEETDCFTDIPIREFDFEYATVYHKDISFNRLCSTMNRMDHPYIIYEDTVITPWDICLTLLSNDLFGPLRSVYREGKRVCPHCGKEIQ